MTRVKTNCLKTSSQRIWSLTLVIDSRERPPIGPARHSPIPRIRGWSVTFVDLH